MMIRDVRAIPFFQDVLTAQPLHVKNWVGHPLSPISSSRTSGSTRREGIERGVSCEASRRDPGGLLIVSLTVFAITQILPGNAR